MRIESIEECFRFNGAVDLNPRKLEKLWEADNGIPLELQWGRGFESTET